MMNSKQVTTLLLVSKKLSVHSGKPLSVEESTK
jgi:hypothetical protein